VTHRRAVAGGLLVTAVACVLAWALAFPGAALTSAAVRALADAAAAVTIGLAVVPALDGPRYRHELRLRAATPLAVASVVWLAAETVRLVLGAAEASGRSALHVGVRTVLSFATNTVPGRADVVAVTAAAAITVTVSVARAPVVSAVAASAAAIGITAHTLSGHLAEDPVGGVAIALHALAAALWCGALAALVLTVRHRGQWARVLPVFSRWALACVAVLLIGGVVSGIAVLDSPVELISTGWGRVLSAKVLLTVALVALAWRNREHWLPAARAHRATADVSRVRAYTELTLMAAALAAAATLAVTG
jgi:copper resistance protein D